MTETPALISLTSHTNIILSEYRATARILRLSMAIAITSANLVFLSYAILILLLPAMILVDPNGGGLLKLTKCYKLSVLKTRIIPSEQAQKSRPSYDEHPKARGTLMFIHLRSLRSLSKTYMCPSDVNANIFGHYIVKPTKICNFTLARSAETDSSI